MPGLVKRSLLLSALLASLRLYLGACTSCDAETLGSCASEAGGDSHESGTDPWVLVREGLRARLWRLLLVHLEILY